jgi:hypothetical protein
MIWWVIFLYSCQIITATATLHSIQVRTDAEYDNQNEAPFIDGIGIGSRVIRGRDWHYDSQDGGQGKRGTVVELRAWKATPNKFKGINDDELKGWDGSDKSTIGVRVLWDETGQANTYRWTSLQKDEKEPPIGPIDLEVVGWRPVTNDMLNSIRGYQDILLESTRKQMASIETIMILRSLFVSLGGIKWKAKRGWEEDAKRIEAHKQLLYEKLNNEQDNTPTHNSQNDISLTATLNALRVNDPCTEGWEGISCRDGTIVGLDLSNNGVVLLNDNNSNRNDVGDRGVLPSELWNLVEMGLVSINLSNNRGLDGVILGNEAFCKGVGSLRFIDLSSCGLGGPLPSCLSKHSSTLETVSLHGNSFEGNIPESWSIMDEKNGGVLRLLQLHNNHNLFGTVPKFMNSKSGLLKTSLPPQLRS